MNTFFHYGLRFSCFLSCIAALISFFSGDLWEGGGYLLLAVFMYHLSEKY